MAVQLPGARLGAVPLRSRPLHVGRWFLLQCSFWLLSGLTSLLNGRVLHIDLVDQNLYVLTETAGVEGAPSVCGVWRRMEVFTGAGPEVSC